MKKRLRTIKEVREYGGKLGDEIILQDIVKKKKKEVKEYDED